VSAHSWPWCDRATTIRRRSVSNAILLTRDLAQTLACSLILSKFDYCNAVFHAAPSGTIRKLRRVQNNAAIIVLQGPKRSHVKPLLEELHWLPVKQRITYKLAVLTFKIRRTSTPVSRNILTPRNKVTRCETTRGKPS